MRRAALMIGMTLLGNLVLEPTTPRHDSPSYKIPDSFFIAHGDVVKVVASGDGLDTFTKISVSYQPLSPSGTTLSEIKWDLVGKPLVIPATSAKKTQLAFRFRASLPARSTCENTQTGGTGTVTVTITNPDGSSPQQADVVEDGS